MKLIQRKNKNIIGISMTPTLYKSEDLVYGKVSDHIFYDLNNRVKIQTYNSVGMKAFIIEKEIENKIDLI